MSFALNTVMGGNLLRWDSRHKPFYEVYYLKLADPAGLWSLWVRYTLTAPKNLGDGQTSRGQASLGQASLGQANLWGIFVKRDLAGSVDITAIKKTYRLGEVDLFHAERFIDIGAGYLSLDSAKGALNDSDHRIEWDLKFEDPSSSLCLYPSPFLYKFPFPKTKFLEPRLSTFVSGMVKKDHDEYHLEHHKAHQAHLWGTQYATRWVWGNCNDFKEDPTATFEGLTAQVPLGSDKFISPPLSLFYFVFEGKEYRANRFLQWFQNKSSATLTEWKFLATCGNTRFEGEMRREPSEIVGLEYLGPRGEKRFCHNSMLATFELQVLRKRPKGWVPYKKLTSKAAAFETVEPEADPQVRFVL